MNEKGAKSVEYDERPEAEKSEMKAGSVRSGTVGYPLERHMVSSAKASLNGASGPWGGEGCCKGLWE